MHMTQRSHLWIILSALALIIGVTVAQDFDTSADGTWAEAIGRAAGTGDNAREEATAQALRTAVEEACGVFLTSQSKAVDYKTVYDKVFANAVGYVKQHKVVRTTIEDGVTVVKVRALVSKQAFEKDWASIAHTIHQENNPRVVVAIIEEIDGNSDDDDPDEDKVKEDGIVQAKIEEFFLSKGIALMDRKTSRKVTKRDVLLAALKDDAGELASLGARFDADVVVSGRARARYAKRLEIAGQPVYQYSGSLTIRVVQTDSGRILASKSFEPITVNTTQRNGGEDKVLAKLGETYAKPVLADMVEAWRKRANVSRTVQLSLSGMDFAMWTALKAELSRVKGVQALRLREISESTGHVDVEYKYSNESLATQLTRLKSVRVKITELTSNRIKGSVTAADE
jgi:hypothetical protein